MRLLDPSVEFRGKTPGVTHKGTFNVSLVAASGVAALSNQNRDAQPTCGCCGRAAAGMRGVVGGIK